MISPRDLGKMPGMAQTALDALQQIGQKLSDIERKLIVPPVPKRVTPRWVPICEGAVSGSNGWNTSQQTAITGLLVSTDTTGLYVFALGSGEIFQIELSAYLPQVISFGESSRLVAGGGVPIKVSSGPANANAYAYVCQIPEERGA